MRKANDLIDGVFREIDRIALKRTVLVIAKAYSMFWFVKTISNEFDHPYTL